MDYAVFKTGGKQYRVKTGDMLDVEKLPLEVDSAAEFENVLAISDGGEVIFGAPYVAGAKVLAQVQSHLQDRKVVVFKYKRKTRYRRKLGHRQEYTRLIIKGIQLGPAASQPSRGRSRSRRRPAAGGAAPEGGNQ